jgi:hypothetical protein
MPGRAISGNRRKGGIPVHAQLTQTVNEEDHIHPNEGVASLLPRQEAYTTVALGHASLVTVPRNISNGPLASTEKTRTSIIVMAGTLEINKSITKGTSTTRMREIGITSMIDQSQKSMKTIENIVAEVQAGVEVVHREVVREVLRGVVANRA